MNYYYVQQDSSLCSETTNEPKDEVYVPNRMFYTGYSKQRPMIRYPGQQPPAYTPNESPPTHYRNQTAGEHGPLSLDIMTSDNFFAQRLHQKAVSNRQALSMNPDINKFSYYSAANQSFMENKGDYDPIYNLRNLKNVQIKVNNFQSNRQIKHAFERSLQKQIRSRKKGVSQTVKIKPQTVDFQSPVINNIETWSPRIKEEQERENSKSKSKSSERQQYFPNKADRPIFARKAKQILPTDEKTLFKKFQKLMNKTIKYDEKLLSSIQSTSRKQSLSRNQPIRMNHTSIEKRTVQKRSVITHKSQTEQTSQIGRSTLGEQFVRYSQNSQLSALSQGVKTPLKMRYKKNSCSSNDDKTPLPQVIFSPLKGTLRALVQKSKKSTSKNPNKLQKNHHDPILENSESSKRFQFRDKPKLHSYGFTPNGQSPNLESPPAFHKMNIVESPPKVKFKISNYSINFFKLDDTDLKMLEDTSIDHVDLNIKNAEKYKKMKVDSYFNNVKQMNIQQNQAKIMSESKLQEKRNKTLKNIKKWEDFRKRRNDVIDQYIQARKKMKIAKQMAQLVIVKSFLKQMWATYLEKQEERKIKHHSAKLALVFNLRLKRHIRRNQGLDQIHRNHIRNVLSITGNSMIKYINEYEIPQIFIQFFLEQIQIQKLVDQGRIFVSNIIKIQKKFRGQFLAKSEKFIVLSQKWDKIQGEIVSYASLNRDQEMTKFVQNLLKINPEVKNTLIRHYLERCNMKHSVAFFQWMYMFLDKDDTQSKQRIMHKLNKISTYFKVNVDITTEVSELTKKLSQVSADSETKYGMCYKGESENGQKISNYMISSFWSLGLPDPFPDESTTLDQENAMLGQNELCIHHLVYPKHRYIKGQSPVRIYYPTRHMMIKMMRACMGCETPEDLWIFKN